MRLFFPALMCLISISGFQEAHARVDGVLAGKLPIPSDQARFLNAVVSARTSYNGAANELAAGGIRSARQQAICNAVIDQQASDWIGMIEKLTSNGDGKGVVSLSMTPFIHISTWNNSLSDILDHTLIDPTSSMFKELAALKVGDSVKFSGQFSSSKTDCVGEKSLTLHGSMTDPEFTMRFTSIGKLEPAIKGERAPAAPATPWTATDEDASPNKPPSGFKLWDQGKWITLGNQWSHNR
jgi:hypothetical protein